MENECGTDFNVRDTLWEDKCLPDAFLPVFISNDTLFAYAI